MSSQNELLTKAKKPAEDAMILHPFYKGKIQVMPKCPVRNISDFSIWYTPGVAEPCKAIFKNRELVYEHTNKSNTIAIISDGTRILGLGSIGPEAGLPVMEGKALLFKYLGGIDAIPICLRTEDPEEIIRTVKILEPSFGGINLEDISQPKCFRILDALREEMTIPVWHDDQQGTAMVLLAGLLNALKIVGKNMKQIRTAMIGMGAANVATYRLIKANGINTEQIIACDRKGVLHKNRKDIEEKQHLFPDKWRICQETNREGMIGGIADALREADVCIAFSRPGPHLINPEWIKFMAGDAIVFACANPTPEIWPWDAKASGARIVATGRSDFPNQLNNSLGFPGLFRGVLDVRARTITDEMAIAAAIELAQYAEERGISEDNILPKMDEWEVYPRIAVAVAMMAQKQGIARLAKSENLLHKEARHSIKSARDATQILIRERIIPESPL